MSNFNHLVINKNRGWRGLAEAKAIDLDTKEELKTIFSFSQAMWDDLMYGNIVLQDDEYYYILTIEDEDIEKLPRGHQRSVLIKSFNANIKKVTKISKSKWTSETGKEWALIRHFIKNKNNHTTSDWNCIGIRVIPEI